MRGPIQKLRAQAHTAAGETPILEVPDGALSILVVGDRGRWHKKGLWQNAGSDQNFGPLGKMDVDRDTVKGVVGQPFLVYRIALDLDPCDLGGVSLARLRTEDDLCRLVYCKPPG